MDQTIFKEFFKYVALNILGQIAYSCYTLADTFFVSANTGTNGLTALNLAFPVFCLVNGIGLMIGIGGGTRYSILKSREETEAANHIFSSALHLVLFFAFFVFLAGLLFSGTIVRLLGADSSVFAITNIYLKVLMLFAPAFLMNNLLQSFVRNDGNPSLSMAAMIIGSFSNIILDYIFIFPLHMGILGAALATGLSPIISMMVLSPYFISKRNHFHYIKTIKDSRNIFKIISSGIPAFLTESASGIVMFLFNYIILRLSGNTGVAAFGVISVISLVVVALYTGLSQGIQPIISQNYGKNHMKNVQLILKYALFTMLLLSIVIYSIIYHNTTFLVSVFNNEKDLLLQSFAETGLKLYFTACPFIGLNIVISTYFISTGRSVPAQIISFLRSFFVLIPTAFLLAYFWEMTGIWCAYPISELLVSFITLFFFIKYKS